MICSIDRARSRALYVGFVLALCGGAGCGESASSAPDARAPDARAPDAPGVLDASVPDSSAPDSRPPDAGTPDAGQPDARPVDPPLPSELESNTPNATAVDVGAPATPTINLVSSNLVQDPSAGRIFQQWVGEIRNVGSTTICQVLAHVRFEDASGAQLAVFDAFSSAEPHMVSGVSLSIGCIRPGEIATLYSNEFVDSAVPLSSVTRIAVAFTSTSGIGAVPAPHAPLITSHVEPRFGGFIVAGSLTGRVGAIYNIGIDVYPRATSGLAFDWLFTSALGTLEPGATVPFSTISTSSSFTEYRVYVHFIDGRKPLRDALAAAALLDDPIAVRELAHRAAQQANRDRAALAHAQ